MVGNVVHQWQIRSSFLVAARRSEARQTYLPKMIASGSSGNPMGWAAMTLARSETAIHGTNQPGSIGHFVSYGCIRMYNEDIKDLYDRVSVGTLVVVK
jgi:lipoprotein-anchoring transpeptidase ErfK/SrfK